MGTGTMSWDKDFCFTSFFRFWKQDELKESYLLDKVHLIKSANKISMKTIIAN